MIKVTVRKERRLNASYPLPSLRAFNIPLQAQGGRATGPSEFQLLGIIAPFRALTSQSGATYPAPFINSFPACTVVQRSEMRLSLKREMGHPQYHLSGAEDASRTQGSSPYFTAALVPGHLGKRLPWASSPETPGLCGCWESSVLGSMECCF